MKYLYGKGKFRDYAIKTILIAMFFIILSINSNAIAEETSYWTDAGIVASSFAGGTGTEADPYLISSASELGYLAYLVNNGEEGSSDETPKHYVLTNNIILTEHEWVPIGAYEGRPFCGNFDGNGYLVSGMIITRAYECIGLFGMVSRNWRETLLADIRVKNLSVDGKITITGFDDMVVDFVDIGGIAGIAGYRLDNCHSNVSISILSFDNNNDITAFSIGGLTGAAGEAKNCSSIGSIYVVYLNNTGYRLPYVYIGGISSSDWYIENCFSATDILVNTETTHYSEYRGITAGGIVGYGKLISNCYSAGSISVEQQIGDNYVGNLVGWGDNGDPGILVRNSYWLADNQVANDANNDGVGYDGQDSEDCYTFYRQETSWQITGSGDNLTDVLNEWVLMQNNALYTGWRNAENASENNGYPVFLTKYPKAEDCLVSGVSENQWFIQGTVISFIAQGAGQNQPAFVGHRRWLPSFWQTNPTGLWTHAPYTAEFATASLQTGEHSLSITFLEEEYDGTNWQSTGRSTIWEIPYMIAALPETSDNANPGLYIVLLTLSVGLIMLVIRKIAIYTAS